MVQNLYVACYIVVFIVYKHLNHLWSLMDLVPVQYVVNSVLRVTVTVNLKTQQKGARSKGIKHKLDVCI